MGDENSTNVNERLSKVETGLVEVKNSIFEVKSDVTIIKSDVSNIKEDIKDTKNRQSDSENSITKLTIAIRENFAKQDQTNIFMKENNSYMKESLDYFKILLEKMTERQDKSDEINNNHYIELIKDNNKQDLDDKTNQISNSRRTMDTVLKIASSPLVTWVLLGAIAAYLFFIQKIKL